MDGSSARLWHPRIRRLYDYWAAAAPCGVLPGRQHVEPADFPDLLPDIWLLDVQRDPFRLRYRLAGTHVVNCVGRELTGRWMDQVQPLSMAPGYLDRYRDVVETGKPSWRRGPPRLHAERGYSVLENILLPLARDGKNVDMLLALTVCYRQDGTVF
jgi:hypothetical protein